MFLCPADLLSKMEKATEGYIEPNKNMFFQVRVCTHTVFTLLTSLRFADRLHCVMLNAVEFLI